MHQRQRKYFKQYPDHRAVFLHFEANKLKNHLAEKSRNLIFALQFKFGLWCNGNTTDFDSVFLGSNPSNPTLLKESYISFPFLFLA